MDFQLPELGEGVYEAELIQWLVQPGDAVQRGQDLAEVQTDKATMELPAPFAGTISALHAEPGDMLKIGAVVLAYEGAASRGDEPLDQKKSDAAAPRAAAKNGNSRRATTAVKQPPLRVPAAPSVRRMARQLGVDLGHVRGSGPGGRVLIDDLTGHVKTVAADGKPAAGAAPQLEFGSPGQRIKLIGLRRKIAQHMVLSKTTIPHYSYMDECDVSELVRLRESLKDAYAKAGVKLTYLAFFVKAAVEALKEVPIVNASLDDDAGQIILHEDYHVGVAVATAGGLIVPVVHDADQKSLAQIAREIERLSRQAKAGKAQLADLKGGRFTLTSIGGIGGLISTPVINHPEVAILGLGKVVRRPVYDNQGEIRPADLVYLSFSFDHRVVDGAVGAAFGNAVIRQMQNPAALLIDREL